MECVGSKGWSVWGVRGGVCGECEPLDISNLGMSGMKIREH